MLRQTFCRTAVVCLFLTCHSIPAAPVPPADSSTSRIAGFLAVRSLKDACGYIRRLSLPEIPFLKTEFIENLPFVGAGGLDETRPIGICLLDGGILAQSQRVIFLIPLKNESCARKFMSNLPWNAHTNRADTVLVNFLPLRLADGYLMLGGKPEITTTIVPAEYLSRVANPEGREILVYNMETAMLANAMQQQAAAPAASAAPGFAKGAELGQKTAVSLCQLAKQIEITVAEDDGNAAVVRLTASLADTFYPGGGASIALPGHCPAVAHWSLPGQPIRTFMQLCPTPVPPGYEEWPAYDKNHPARGTEMLCDLATLLVGGGHVSAGFAMENGRGVYYAVKDGTTPEATDALLARLEQNGRAVGALCGGDFIRRDRCLPADGSPAITRLSLQDSNQAVAFVDVAQRGNRTYLTLAADPGWHILQLLAPTAPQVLPADVLATVRLQDVFNLLAHFQALPMATLPPGRQRHYATAFPGNLSIRQISRPDHNMIGVEIKIPNAAVASAVAIGQELAAAGSPPANAMPKTLGEAIRQYPDFPPLHMEMCDWYAATGNIFSAITECTAAIRCNPAYVTPWRQRAKLLALLGKYDAALTDEEAAFRLLPTLPAETLPWLVVWAELAGKTEEAAKFRKLCRLPETAARTNRLGQALLAYLGGSLPRQELLKMSADKTAQSPLPELLFVVGMLDLAAGRRTEAQEILLTALAQAGNGKKTPLLLLAAQQLRKLGVSDQKIQTAIGTPPPRPIRAEQPKPCVFEDKNCQYVIPSMEYHPMPSPPNSLASLVLQNRTGSIGFALVAEAGSAMVAFTPETVAQFAQDNQKQRLRNATCSIPEKAQVGNLPGLRFTVEGTAGTLNLFYVYWVYARNGYCYQALVWGAASDQQQVRTEADKLFSGFSQLDPDRFVYDKKLQPFGRWQSEAYGCVLDLGGTGWMSLPDDTMGNAEIRGQLKADAGLAVTPLRFEHEPPPPHQLAKVLLTSINIPQSTEVLQNAVTAGTADGVTMDFSFLSDGNGRRTEKCFCRLVAGPQCGYLISVWGTPENPRLEEQAKNVFAAFRQIPAATPPPLGEAQRKKQALLQNELGLCFFNARQFDKSLPCFQAAHRNAPEGKIIFGNLLNTLCQLGRHAEALDNIGQAREAVRNDNGTLAWQAACQSKTGSPGDALATYRRLFAGSYRSDDDFMAYATLLAAKTAGDFDAAFTRYLANGSSARLRLKQAELLGVQKRHQEAITILLDERRQRPDDNNPAFAMIREYHALGDYRQSLAVCNELNRQGLESGDSCYWKGVAEYKLGWYREARASFEQSLKHNPNDAEAKSYLAHVSGLLGEGSRDGLASDIAPVSIPAVIGARRPPLTAKPPVEEGNAFYHSRICGVQYLPGKECRKTTYGRYTVLDAGSLSAYSTISVYFNPLTEKVGVNYVRVLDKQGQEAAIGRLQDYYTVDAPNGSDMASHDKRLIIPVPGLQAGFTVDYAFTVAKLNADRFEYTPYLFAGTTPAIQQDFFIRCPANSLQYNTPDGIKRLKLEDGMAWVCGHPAAFAFEPLSPFASEFLPQLVLTDARDTWESESANYLKRIQDMLAPGKECARLSAEITAGCKNDREKYAAIVRRMQTLLTYKAIEFGRRAQIPNTPEQILHNKYGDCKDHAVLLRALLAGVGIESQLVLANTAAPILRNLPSLDQFNHMILHVPAIKKSPFIDATVKTLDPAIGITSNLAGREVLVLAPAKPFFKTVPAVNPENCQVHAERTVEITADGHLRVHEVLTLAGYYAAGMRIYYQNMPAKDRLKNSQALLAANDSSVQLTRLDVAGTDPAAKECVLTLDYGLDNAVRRLDRQLLAAIPYLWEADYLRTSSVKNRENPFKIDLPLVFTSTTTMKSPRGHVPLLDKTSKHAAHCGSVRWTSLARPVNDGVVVEFTCELRAGTFAKDKYEQHRQRLEEAFAVFTQGIAFTPK